MGEELKGRNGLDVRSNRGAGGKRQKRGGKATKK